MEAEAMTYERDSANKGRAVSQDALARMAIRNAEMKVKLFPLGYIANVRFVFVGFLREGGIWATRHVSLIVGFGEKLCYIFYTERCSLWRCVFLLIHTRSCS